MACHGPYLTAGAVLTGGDHLLSPNGQYSAVMQDDGDFVRYWGCWPDRLVGSMWATNTAKRTERTHRHQGDPRDRRQLRAQRQRRR
jgi:hypothetical protein